MHQISVSNYSSFAAEDWSSYSLGHHLWYVRQFASSYSPLCLILGRTNLSNEAKAQQPEPAHPSWVCPKQYLACALKAAFSRYVADFQPFFSRILVPTGHSSAPTPFSKSCFVLGISTGLSALAFQNSFGNRRRLTWFVGQPASTSLQNNLMGPIAREEPRSQGLRPLGIFT
jgi:hypothetical protein